MGLSTNFTVNTKRVYRCLHVAKTPSAVLPSNATQPPRVLVVDDDKSIRTLLTAVLTRKAFLVEAAQNGDEAIGVIAEREFDAIVLDLMMPKVDGFEVIEHLERTMPDRLRRCVIVLTAVADRDLRKLDEKQVFRVLRKPFDLDEFVEAVTECVNSQSD
ncbi:MAG: two-component system, NtrC family, response regulator PilR [Thermoanaerobaculia bacterium]|jgi:CheY-like chemotaxis protein|nr:two-component system, NtrC family, response regulator PilR [Thermoanaerobaculia bacterium]